MKPPSLEEILLECAKCGLPEHEGQKFHAYYSGRGWCQGRYNAPIKVWRACLSGWKLRWQECQQHQPGLSNMDKLLRLKELERIEAKMKAISGSYSENMTWEATDRLRYKELRIRKEELLKLLQMTC